MASGDITVTIRVDDNATHLLEALRVASEAAQAATLQLQAALTALGQKGVNEAASASTSVFTIDALTCEECGEGPFRSTKARGAHKRHRHPKIDVQLCACGHPERVHDDDHEGDGRGACMHPACYEAGGCSEYRAS